jgi:1-acyl-sn-glycerol-3-phosphate acyltransferase
MPGTTTSVSRRDPSDVAGVAESVLTIARDLAREIHPGRKATERAGLDSLLDRDWGFDSLSRTELFLRVERAFATRLPEQSLGEAESLRDLVEALSRATASSPDAQIPLRQAPAPEAAEPAPDSAATLTEVLDWHVREHGERVHVVLLDGDGHESTLTYRQVSERARAVALGLERRGLQAGERVAIMLPSDETFFAAFFGILYAGGVPCPIYPPARLSRIEEHLQRQARILDNARAAMLIAPPEAAAVGRLLRLQVESLRSLDTVDELASASAPGALPDSLRHTPQPNDMALVQYTSGSTGDPKGVVLTHANVLANIRAMGEVMEAGSHDVFVSWLPLYHDLGLIGAWLGSLYFAAPVVVMSPLTFLVRPETWLWAMHRHRATLSAAPNFAFELCLRKVEDSTISGLDLSSVRMVANGAEAVVPDTLRRFTERFGRYGFRSEAMAPVYGLAENTVGLAFPPLGRRPVVDRIERKELARHGRAVQTVADVPDAVEFVAVGRPLPQNQIRIVDANGEVGERREGHLQFRGPSSTSGYLDNAEKTRELFDGPWLNSGDLAYVAGGDIFITGRSKDIVIRAGRHIWPEEIEIAVGDLEGIRKGCVAVFGSTDPRAGTERLVVVAETRLTEADALATLRQRVGETAARLLDAPPEEIVLVPPGSVAKTSSGKLRRAATRDLFHDGRLGARPRSATHQIVRLAAAGLAAWSAHTARAIGALAYGAWWWLVLVIGSAILWPATVLMPGRARRWSIVRRAARSLLRLMGIRVEVTGTWPESGPGPEAAGIVAINHCSYFDSLVLAAVVPGQPAFIAKRELDGQWVAGPFLRALGALFVERDDLEGGLEDMRSALAAARTGETLYFFPEGTFTRAYGLRPFRLGAFVIAVDRQVGVVPVALRGTRSVLRDGEWLPRRGNVSVHIGEVSRPDGGDFSAAVRLRDRVRSTMLAHINEPDLAPASRPG